MTEQKNQNEVLIIRNALRTPDGTILESSYQHDYQEYKDKNGKTYMIDGGLSYIRCSANGDEEFLTIYNNEPHESQRCLLKWGSYGKYGDKPLVKIMIRDMETEHIESVLRDCSPSKVFKDCMEKELDFRKRAC